MDKIPPPALLPLAHALNAKAVHIHVLIRVFLAPFVGSFIGAAAAGKVAAVAGVIAFARSQAPHFADLFAGVVYMWLIGFIIGLFAAGITSLMGIPLVVLCRRGRILDALIVMVFAFLISICVYNQLERTPGLEPDFSYFAIRIAASIVSVGAISWMLGRAPQANNGPADP